MEDNGHHSIKQRLVTVERNHPEAGSSCTEDAEDDCDTPGNAADHVHTHAEEQNQKPQRCILCQEHTEKTEKESRAKEH